MATDDKKKEAISDFTGLYDPGLDTHIGPNGVPIQRYVSETRRRADGTLEIKMIDIWRL